MHTSWPGKMPGSAGKRQPAQECAGTRNSREDPALERGLPHPAALEEGRSFVGLDFSWWVIPELENPSIPKIPWIEVLGID